MHIFLNYVLFAVTLAGALSFAGKGRAFRSPTIHMLLFSAAALFGGLAHQIEADRDGLQRLIQGVNSALPLHFRVGSGEQVHLRVWMITLLCVGATEYYFMHIFLHPVARNLGRKGALRTAQVVFVLFCTATLLTYDYAIVIAFHVVSHVVVIGISVWLITTYRLRAYYALIALCLYNLAAGGLWALMGLGLVPDGPLHYNDWYHISLIGFVVLLHQLITRYRLVERLESSGSSLQSAAGPDNAIPALAEAGPR